MRSIITFLFVISGCLMMSAQEFQTSLDFRDRFELRHGFGTLFPDGAEPAAFVRQRARLNVGYTHDWVDLQFSVQDISTWGDTRQILPQDDNGSLMIFEAWAKLKWQEKWSLKLGRQVISYDDQRILGGLDWAMQGRTHDAALIRHQNNGLKIDLAFAFNQQNEPLIGNAYPVTGFFSYKTMQFLHMTKSWEKGSTSFLFLNNGFQNFTGPDNDIADGVYYRQTTGLYTKNPVGEDLALEGFAYLQFGKATNETDLSAYDVGLEATYKPGNTLFGLGFEMLSGTDQDGESKNKSFFPLYGTNHKFNGFMDYFYVGNHANNVGLNDLFARVTFKTGEKSNLLVKGHYFAANADLSGGTDKYLGTELDLVFTQKLFTFATLNLGYSHMFASDSMSLIKGGTTNDNTNYWGWAQIKINPVLFKHSWADHQ
ncbi:alginate export family protein [Robertkochia sediminum]|uniref:hypothetical protein n=1 Tax=Robertkochia sediminum TaxID=2785326 RepID=UPI0019346C18|nr:hypothetical protein [Robertkochia sediminum]MBL7471532.1 hypothetical protein [Robertkochia sediminum]